MRIRAYRESDAQSVSELFYDTVRCACRKDYTNAQLSVWAKDEACLLCRSGDLISQNTLIAEENGEIVGFGSIDGNGYLDLLFVHRAWQRRGIARALCEELEAPFDRITTHASVTAKPFFEKRGYRVSAEREAVREGISLKYYEMEKLR